MTTSTDIHMSVARIVSSVAQCHIICTRTAAQDVWVFAPHPHGHLHVSVSPRLDSPFLFSAPPHVLQFLKFVVNLHTPPNESMDSTDEFSLSTFSAGFGILATVVNLFDHPTFH